jgi:Leucine-rich repeat (LRR) protein
MSHSITSLPHELQQDILTYVRNPLQTSLVCSLWHQLTSDEPVYRSILSSIQSSMNEAQFTQLLRNFDVQLDAPAISKVRQLFKRVYQLRGEYLRRDGIVVKSLSDCFYPLHFHEALQSIKVLEEKEIEDNLNDFLDFLRDNFPEVNEFSALHQQGMPKTELAQKIREYLLETLNNRSIVLPRFIRQCAGLTTLIIESTNDELPKEVYQCVSLNCLSIQFNLLKKLSNEIGHLKQLTSLVAFGNQISELPPTIGELKELSYIDLEMNSLKRVPRSLLSLPKLNRFILESSWQRNNEQSLEDFLINQGIEIYDEETQELKSTESS